jgi:GNAT superfamily N-acetyltransferase
VANPIGMIAGKIAAEVAEGLAKKAAPVVASAAKKVVSKPAQATAKRTFERVPTKWGDEAVTTFVGKDGNTYSAKLNLNHENWANQHAVDISRDGKEVGSLTWNALDDTEVGLKRGMVSAVDVVPEFRRKGIATTLWEIANDASKQFGLIRPIHSTSQTAEGKAWVASLNRKHRG